MSKLRTLFLICFCLVIVFLSACQQKTEDADDGSVLNPEGIVAESVSVTEPVLTAARNYVQNEYDYWCNSTGHYGIVDGVEQMIGNPAFYDNWRIEGLSLMHSYNELDGQLVNEFSWAADYSWDSIDIYRLDYRIHTTTPDKVKAFLAGGMDLDNDGWLLPTYPESTYLIFVLENGYLKYLFPMMENDCSPGDETFTNDLKNQLISSKDSYNEAMEHLRDLFSDGESTIWYMPAGEGRPETIPDKISYIMGEWYKGRYEVLFNCIWTKVDSAYFNEPTGASLFLGDSTDSCFQFYLGSGLVVWRDGENMTVWGTYDSWGYTLPDMMMIDFSGYEIDIENLTVPVMEGETAEDTLYRFLNAYGEHLMHVTPENISRITDFKVLDFYETQTSDTKILLRFNFAVKPPEELYQSTPWWAGNSGDGEGELEGWLVMYREMVLEQEEGVWRCIGFGTGGYSLDTQEPESSSPWSEPVYGEEKDFIIMIEGMEETVTMTYTEFDFSHWPGAAKVSLYIDRERYSCRVFEGEYDILPVGSDGDPIGWLHVFPEVGKTAQEVFDETKIFLESAERGDLTGEGTVELDNHTVLYITTSVGETDYFIDYDGGCIVLSTRVEPEAVEGLGVRLAAMVRTVKIIE